MEGRQLAKALGWFSLALGLVELVQPRRMSTGLGLRGRGRRVQAYGLRELATGAAILASGGRQPAWLWARVVGDLLDMGLLQSGRPTNSRRRRNRTIAKAAVAGAAAMDLIAARGVSRRRQALTRAA